jgi:hypothetical protein
MKFRLRYSIAAFLTTVCILGSAIGLGVRWHLASQSEYVVEKELVGHTNMYASWKRNGLGQEQLIYLVVFPPGEATTTGGGAGIYRKPQGIITGVKDAIGIYPQALYVNEKPVNTEEQKIFVYRLVQKDVKAIELPQIHQELRRLDFLHLETSEIFESVLEPAAKEQFRTYLASLDPDTRRISVRVLAPSWDEP